MRTSLRLIPALLASLAAISCGGDGAPSEPETSVATVAISGKATVAPGATTQLTATAKNASGIEVTGLTVSWASTYPEIATVNGAGLVNGLTTGSTIITATVDGVPGLLGVTVSNGTNAPPPTADANVDAGGSNTFNPGSVEIAAGGTVSWTFNAGYGAGHNVTFDAVNGAPADIGTTETGSVSRSFPTAGTFNYHCTNHAGMTGTVVVHQ
jgi:plastocyanin